MLFRVATIRTEACDASRDKGKHITLEDEALATIVENWELVPEPEFSEKRPIYHLVRSHAGAGILTLRNERNRRESKTQSDAEFRFLAEVVCRKEANASVEMTKTGLKSGFVSRAAIVPRGAYNDGGGPTGAAREGEASNDLPLLSTQVTWW